MPDISLKDIQIAIKDNLDTCTYNSEETSESIVYPLIERRYTTCLVFC